MGGSRVLRDYGPRLSVLTFQRITPEFAYQSLPKPASSYDLLKAAALIWAHGMRFQSSISLPCNELHLVHKMPLWMREARPGT